MKRAGRSEEYVYGVHAVTALIRQDPLGVLGVWVQQDRRDARLERLCGQLREHGLKAQSASRKGLDRMANGARHQGVVARYRGTSKASEPDLSTFLETTASEQTFFLVLDQVVDPRNLGACLRSAAAAGVDAVLVPRHRSAPLSAAARKTASGAAELVPLVVVPNLASALGAIRAVGIRSVGATLDAVKSVYDVDLAGPLALVLGGEEHGLRRLTRESCDELAYIPMADEVQSLNVSAAAAVLLFEARRQRGAGPHR